MVFGAEKIPAQPHVLSLALSRCGALSVPKKKLALPDVAASTRAKPMAFAFGNWKAIIVWANTANQNIIAVDNQVMRGDRSS